MVLNDINTYRQVIGCLMKKPLLFTEYQDLRIQDFELKVPRIIFSVIKNMFESGAMELSPVEVDLEIENHEVISVIYRTNKGLDFLKEAYEYSKLENFEYYYKRLKKLSLLRELKRNSYDISSFYKENYDSLKEEEKANELFENSSIDDILLSVESKYNKIKNDFINGGKHSGNASIGLRDLVDELMLKPEIGPSLCGEYFSTACRGARLGKYYLRSASSGSGKAITNTTLIPMADGTWKTVGEVKVGDRLIGLNGKPTNVLMIYPQQEKKRVYEVVFKDGRKIECCEEHLWTYYYKSHENWELKTSPLKELYDKKITIGLNNEKGAYRFKIPLPSPIEYKKKELYPSPYIMGLILGDGSFRYTDNQKCFSFSSEDEELPLIIGDYFGAVAHRNSEKKYSWRFKINDYSNLWVEDVLIKYPELLNKKSEEKFIPEDYLYSSKEDRIALLQGLLDTDGSIDKKGRINFTSVSKQMIYQVRQLCLSLGFVTKITEDKRDYKYTTGICYNLRIQCPKKIKYELFRLERKKERAKIYANSSKREERRDWLPIVDIIKTDRFEDMTCFTVDAEDSLFLVGEYIPTHNTRLSVFDACKICFPIHYSLEKGTFVVEVDKDGDIREPRKTLVITTEMGKDEIQTIVLAYLSGVNEAHILTGQYELGEKDRVYYATQIVEKYQNSFYIEEISDPNLTNIESTIKRYATIEEVDFVFYDYIFSSPSLVAQFSDSKLREDELESYVLLHYFSANQRGRVSG